MESGEHTAVIVCVLVIAGMLLGVSVGRCGESGTEVLVRTTTVKGTTTPTTTSTTTVTVARTKTVTAPVDTQADTVEEDVPATGTTDPTENCSPDYLGACVPLDAAGITCSEIAERDFDSVGDDPYGLDPDGDSFACER